MKTIQNILVATDFSEDAAEATLYALELARKFGASLTLFHSFQFPTYVFPDGSAFAASADVITQIARQVDEALAAAKKAAEAAGGVAVQTRSSQGIPYAAILEAARDYDLVVMGTHGRTGLKHLLAGSVAEHVVRRASCPVLTVRHSAAN